MKRSLRGSQIPVSPGGTNSRRSERALAAKPTGPRERIEGVRVNLDSRPISRWSFNVACARRPRHIPDGHHRRQLTVSCSVDGSDVSGVFLDTHAGSQISAVNC